MAHMFPVAAGRIVQLPGNGVPMGLSLEGWAGFSFMSCLLTSAGLHEQCNVQFFHTLRDFIYVYSFGDRLADMTVGGYAATAQPCGQGTTNSATGFEKSVLYWRTNRLARRGQALTITIGTQLRFSAFLIAAKFSHEDPATGLARFAYDLRYPIPKVSPPIPGQNAENPGGDTDTIPGGTIIGTPGSLFPDVGFESPIRALGTEA